MSSQSHAHAHAHDPHDPNAPAEHGNYIQIWGILLVLLIVSVGGPFLGNKWITLLTAFGVAGVKAFLVVTKFMHIGHAPKFVGYIIGTCVVFMFLFFGAVSPDVMKHEGRNWENASAQKAVKTALDEAAHGGGAHHE